MVAQTVYADGKVIYHDGSLNYQDWLRNFEHRKAQEYKPYYNGPFPGLPKGKETVPKRGNYKTRDRWLRYAQGATDKQMAEEFGRTVEQIKVWREHNGLDENFVGR